ncbi:uncharacterized protein LOC110744764 [Prunus avium]|uniref:Uncharacterized protein LOC110744764 n=1 Tax=Prunus avium TaxID=42229 RepID=A0A6P5RF39_PRUAV|nr:uncharacterized protein LOC110744764 [Prunus avium]
MQRISKIDNWLLALISNSAFPIHVRKELLASVSIICWEIWKERCNALFSHFPPDPGIVLRKATARIFERKGSIPDTTDAVDVSHVFWRPPREGLIKINVDGAWHKNTMHGAVGCVIRDNRGNLIGGASSFTVRSSPEEVEAEAILEGLKLARTMHLQHIVVESDSKVVIESISKKKLMLWRIFPLLAEIWRRTSFFSRVVWSWVPRKANCAAHAAAALTNSRVRHVNWATLPPPSLVLVLSKDGLPCPPP